MIEGRFEQPDCFYRYQVNRINVIRNRSPSDSN